MQNFRKLREQDCYYVDKTPYIERLLDEGSHHFGGRITGPSGTQRPLPTVWIVRDGEVSPRFVTAYPGSG